MKKLKNSILKVSVLIFFAIASILDLYSTIIQRPEIEENPIVRYIWQNYGNIGFLLFSLIMTLIPILIVWKMKKTVYYITLLILALFVLLIALTNLALVPISWTSWFYYEW